ncbi:MAG: M20 family metallo-hydrolase [Geminicoccales bacterium]
MTDLGLRAAAAVRQDRLWKRHSAMAKIGAIPGDGVNRQALSQEDIRARALLIAWAEARRYHVSVDGIANLFIRRQGIEESAAPVLVGSHMDSQPLGGRFDGIYGVLAGFEVLEALDDAGITTKLPVEVVAWTNEEGGRFSPGAMGSAVFAGARDLKECLSITDPEGVSFTDALAKTLNATPKLERRPFNFPLSAYIEPHIEQGPELEALGLPIGVVTGIQGSRWYLVKVQGESAHAGTAPIKRRRDALSAAVQMITGLQALMRDETDRLRFTVGRFDVIPNSPNTVPEEVLFSIDFRHPDLDVLNKKGDQIAEICKRLAGPCEVTLIETFNRPPSVFAERLVDSLENAARALDLGSLRMPSGAFHDANFLAEICPTAMLFVPCENGISHNPAENAKPEDLAAGAKVLAAAVMDIAGTV